MSILKNAFLLLGTLQLLANSASAHFPWLIRTEDGKAAYFFGESPHDRTYKLPASIAKAEVNWLSNKANLRKLQMKSVSNEAFVGMHSEHDIPVEGLISSRVTFGVYHGSRLEYYALHLGGALPTDRADCRQLTTPLKLAAELVDTGTGVEVFVTWDGKPLAGTDIQLYPAAGHPQASATTDATGKVAFNNEQIDEGVNGILVGFDQDDQSGVLGGEEYRGESHYLTVTFHGLQDVGDDVPEGGSSINRVDFADLPLALTSFGAARIDDAIYVYGGHTGEAHSYSIATQSNQLLKLDLRDPSKSWEQVGEGLRIQGLAMVAHAERLICIGGFTARNAPGTEHDLRSLTEVRAFDVVNQTWSELAALPEGRSSHDAAMLGDKIYVVGGWNMNGTGQTLWHSSALTLDLSQTDPTWEEIAKPPFTRRALAAVAHLGKLYAIGGMNEHGGPTREVAVFDPDTKTWSAGPALVGERAMEGFGASAWSIQGQLIATTYSGVIQQLDESGEHWKVIGKARDARFFHRLLPLGPQSLLSLGGANMEQQEKFLDPEIIELPNSSATDSKGRAF